MSAEQVVSGPGGDKIPPHEIFVGLIGPVGADLAELRRSAKSTLQAFGYEVTPIRVSQLLHKTRAGRAHNLAAIKFEDDRINGHMNAGNEFRCELQRPDAMALLSVAEIVRIRVEKLAPSPKIDPKLAYIVDSLKNPREIEFLRSVYGNQFVSIAGYSPRLRRVESLARTICYSRSANSIEQFRGAAEDLIARDAEEVGDPYGQNVRNAFAVADLYVDIYNAESILLSMQRFFDLCFGHPYETPTLDEFGMYLAHGASLRSADLSRQVGASVFSKSGDLVAVGCNEVPAVGGGAVWPESLGSLGADVRDFARGFDPNERVKQQIIAELFSILEESNLLNSESYSSDMVPKTIQKGGILENSRLNALLEFGRIVHAEMDALTTAARVGVTVCDATLYCTTFPCHVCARHIVASGVRRVVYVEPYPKSLAGDLYEDHLTVEAGLRHDKRTAFEPFVGIAPRLYERLFRRGRRKHDDGRALDFERQRATPVAVAGKPTYGADEQAALAFLAERKAIALADNLAN